jgi:hypothetical protein
MMNFTFKINNPLDIDLPKVKYSKPFKTGLSPRGICTSKTRFEVTDTSYHQWEEKVYEITYQGPLSFVAFAIPGRLI